MDAAIREKIKLSFSDFIASGRHRVCYQHPFDNSRCIKIHHNAVNIKETLRETRYYYHINNRKRTPSTIPKYYGTLETNLGKGYVFQLIKDNTGCVSQTLDYYLRKEGYFEENKKEIQVAYMEFREQIYNDAIATMTLKTYNIVYQLGYKPYGKFVLVDNLGSAKLIPLDYFSVFARLTLRRRFADFEKLLYRAYSITI
ncbi:YrbL family protein [Dryocola clanedunensis]|uniref:YrbL family protein n=1 Tax=Cedecea sulfonylureivorans TaxID=3051154 RepID=UPI0019266789|nr:YrbL family protein [Cedecea sulfonylureivorans]